DDWFPPSPRVIAALQEHLPWLLRTSPPAACEGLVRTIARVRGVTPDSVLPGGGSSELIFLAFRHWLEYAGAAQSLERFAARSENVVVCKSLSKVYALSGARAAYLCARPHQLEALRSLTPPWSVSLPAQVAAVKALQDPGYYAQQYRKTCSLRRQLCDTLRSLGWATVPRRRQFHTLPRA